MTHIDDKRRAIKEIDKDFDIDWNDGVITVTHKGQFFQTIKNEDYTRETLANIQRVKWLNENGRFENYIDEYNEGVKKAQEKKIEDMAYNMAKDIRRPLLQDYAGW